MKYTFHAEQWVPYSPERVFAFFADPQNLPLLMPRWQDARIDKSRFVAPSDSDDVKAFAGAGSEMTITFRPIPFSPIRISWEARIVEFVWNHHFCDEQPRGPFHYWRHCHHIAAEARGDTAGAHVKDDLEYELPLGFLGDLAQKIFVGQQVQAIFAHRQKRLLELLAVS